MNTTRLTQDSDKVVPLFRRRVYVVCGLVITVVGLLVLRLAQLQIIEHETYATRSESNRIEIQTIPPPRGLIYDRNGTVLARNRTVLSLAIVPEQVSHLENLIAELRSLVAFAPSEFQDFKQRLERRRRPMEPVTLRRELSDGEVAALAVNRYRLNGVVVTMEQVRHYPFGELTAHAVGSVRRISIDDLRQLSAEDYRGTHFIGRRGVEKFYEDALHGSVGSRNVEVDAHGRIYGELSTSPPTPGQDLTLHLDVELQRVADEALGDRRGAVVAIDPRSGGVLAMISKPSYDPNIFATSATRDRYAVLSGSPDKPLVNRATTGRYPPGSTIKPVIALAARSLDVVTWDEEIIDPNGEFSLPNSSRIYRDWNWTVKYKGGHGELDLHRAIYRSSNIFFFHLSTRMSVDQIGSFAAQFGYGQDLSVDIPDADSGLLPTSQWKRATTGESWYPGDTVNLSIGQGSILVTPLQAAVAAATLANRGQVVRPRMLRSSDDLIPGEEPNTKPPAVTGVEDEDWDKMIAALEAVVHRGNQGYRQNGVAWAHIGQSIPFRMAGKTGTAQVVGIDADEVYDETLLDEYQRKHAWFIAFAPTENPTIAIAVLVENGGGGAAVAAPIARTVFDAYLVGGKVATL